MRDLFELAFDRCRHELFQSSLSAAFEEDGEDDFYTQTFDESDLLEENNSPLPIRTPDTMLQQEFDILVSSPPSSSSSNVVTTNLESHNRLFHDFDSVTERSLHENLRKEARDRLQMIRVSRERYSKYTSNAIDSFNLAKRRMEDRRNHVEENCRLHYHTILRRLKIQRENADRRLRELLYEIIGEYGKSEIRVSRRHSYLKYASRVNMMWSLWKLRWQRYVSRLCLEIIPHELSSERSINYCNGTLLCPRIHLEEIRAVGNMIQKCLSESSFKVSAVVRFERKIRSIEQLSDSGFQLASTPKEYRQLVTALKTWLAPSNTSRTSVSRDGHRVLSSSAASSTSTTTTPMKSPNRTKKTRNQVDKDGMGSSIASFISCEPIEWVHPASFFPEFWDTVFPSIINGMPSPANTNTHTEGLDEFMTRFMSQHTSTIACDRVFYCLQERNLALKGPSSFPGDKNSPSLDLLHRVESIYVYNKDIRNISQTLFNLRSDIEEPQIVQQPCSTHRVCVSEALVGSQREEINGYPDIIQTESNSGSLYHYAPALSTNLAETRAFAECGFTSDQIRDMSTATCPHPHIAYLASSQFAPLETLYVMVRTSPKASSNESISPEGSFYMVPLTSACVKELIKTHLLSPLQPAGMEHVEVVVKDGKPLTGCSSLDLLPDHARKCDTRGLKQLRHRYAIVYSNGEYKQTQNDGNDDNQSDTDQHMKKREKKFENNVKPTSYNNQPSQGTIAGAYYLVQLSPVKNNDAQNSPSSPGSNFPSPRTLSPRKDDNSSRLSVEDELHQKDERLMNILLIAYSRGMGDTLTLPVSSSDTVKRQQQWQNALLSGVCRWRSCLCDSVDSKKMLCRYHLDLKKFLDKRQKLFSKSSSISSSSLESNKYMPRKPPELSGHELDQVRRSVSLQVQYDMSMIRAASTLLVELWDGNLRNTLKSYIKRVREEMSMRNRLENITLFATARTKKQQQSQAKKDSKDGNNSYSGGSNTMIRIISRSGPYPSIVLRSLPPQQRPTWHQWCDKNELSGSFDRILAAQNHVDSILRIEKSISLEIHELVRLGIFPSFEITMIRKDMKKFKELEEMKENGDLDRETSEGDGNKINIEMAEVGLCERKLSLLRARKEDELELRVKSERKAKKLAMQQQNITPEKEYQMRF